MTGPGGAAQKGPPPCRARDRCGHVFHCPACGAGSAHPDDARYLWCGACGDVSALAIPDARPASPSRPLPGR